MVERDARVAAIRADVSLSDHGKHSRVEQADREMLGSLERIATGYVSDEDKLLRAFGGRGDGWVASRELTAPAAARISATLATLQYATPVHALTVLQDAVEVRDRAALTFLLPAIEGLSVSDTRYTDIASDVAHWTALAREALGDEARDAFEFAREVAAAMRAQLSGALTIAARERRWDPVYDSTGNLSLFDEGIAKRN
jgi:hypothetical protein